MSAQFAYTPNHLTMYVQYKHMFIFNLNFFKNFFANRRRKQWETKMEEKIAMANGKDDEILDKEKKRGFTPDMMLTEDDTVLRELCPNIHKLLLLLCIFPISVACVERLFSRMKLIKTRLRNRLLDVTLENLIYIALESNEVLEDEELESLVNQYERKNPSMRLDV